MKLLSLEAENFGSYRKLFVDYTKFTSLNLIRGANGAGKSKFVDAVSYAIWGKSIEGTSLKSLANRDVDGTMRTVAMIESHVHDAVFRIERTYRKGKSSVTVSKVAEDKKLLEVTRADVAEQIEEIVGINFQTFQFIYRFGGGETGNVPYAAAGVGFHRKIQDTLIQADRITACLLSARAMKNELAKRAENLSSLLERERSAQNESASVLNDLRLRHQEEKTKYEDSWSGFMAIVNKWEKFDFKTALEEAVEFKDLKFKKHDYISQLSDAESKLESESRRLNLAKEKIKLAYSKKEELSQKEPLKGIADLESRLFEISDSLMKAKENLSSVSKTADERAETIGEISSLEHDCAKYKDVLKRYESELESIQELEDPKQKLEESRDRHSRTQSLLEQSKQSLMDIEKQLENLGDVPTLLRSVKSRLVTARDSAKHIESELEKASSAVTQLDSDKKTCPACGGNMEDAAASKMLSRYRSDVTRLKKDLEIAQQDLERLQKEIDNLSQQETLYVQLRQDRDNTRSKINDLQLQLNNDDTTVRSYEEMMRKYSQRYAELDIKKDRVESTKTSIDGLEKRIFKLSEKIKQFEGMEDEKLLKEDVLKLERKKISFEKSIRDLREEEASLRCELSSLDSEIRSAESSIGEYEERVSEAKNVQDDISSKIVACTKRISQLLYSDGSEPVDEEWIKSKQAIFQNAKDGIKGLKNWVNPIDQLVFDAEERLEKTKDECIRLHDEIAIIDSEKPYYEWWIKAFDSDGIRSVVMKEMVPLLNQTAERYMTLLSDACIGFRFDDSLELKLFRTDSGRDVEYEECSGGQRKRINVAVTLAFLDAINISSGCNFNLFVLDEASEALDPPGMQGLAESILDISGERIILVITHSKELQDALVEKGANEILIECEDGISEWKLL